MAEEEESLAKRLAQQFEKMRNNGGGKVSPQDASNIANAFGLRKKKKKKKK